MHRPSVVAATAAALLQPRIAGAAAAPAASAFRHVTRQRQHTTMRHPMRSFSSSTYTLSAAPSDAASDSVAEPDWQQQQQQQQKPQPQQRRTGWIVAGVAVLSFCLGRASIERGPEVEPQYPQFQQQQQQSEDKHVRGERKLPSLIETPTDAPVVAAATPSSSASPSNKTDAAGLPVTFTAAGAGTAASEEEPSPTHPDHSSCRACRDGGEAAKLSAYEAQLAAEAEANAVAAAAAASFSVNADGTAATTGGLPSPATAASPTCPPCFAYSHSLCPLNRAEVGRAAWGFLHTVAAYYPSHPTPRQQEDMASLLSLYVKLYPCGYCADRSMEHLEREPIEQHVRSQNDLAQWMCRMHNEVNERLGKPMFDCQYVNQRWRDGQSKTKINIAILLCEAQAGLRCLEAEGSRLAPFCCVLCCPNRTADWRMRLGSRAAQRCFAIAAC
jgi:FAD-linked sulfhydryl oxidase